LRLIPVSFYKTMSYLRSVIPRPRTSQRAVKFPDTGRDTARPPFYAKNSLKNSIIRLAAGGWRLAAGGWRLAAGKSV
jgi:hypothetical protein